VTYKTIRITISIFYNYQNKECIANKCAKAKSAHCSLVTHNTGMQKNARSQLQGILLADSTWVFLSDSINLIDIVDTHDRLDFNNIQLT